MVSEPVPQPHQRVRQLRVAKGDFLAQLDGHFLKGQSSAYDMCSR